jgi:ABC-2 type transport system ATP-binding protein
MQARIEIQHLTRYYGALAAVRDVSLSLASGSVVGLLGPNGSGKTTTVSMLAGLREPSAGRILFDGADIAERIVEYKARIGYVPEEAHLYPFLSGREQLDLVGRLRRVPAPLRRRKIAALLELFGMGSAADQPISAYSKGMRQKIVIVAALLHDPDVIILDEPESGLDLAASLVLRHLIPILAARGKAVLYSSHVLEYVERLCGAVIVLNRGRVVAAGPVSQLRTMMQREASLEDMVVQLVAVVDPRGTAADIADVVGARL